MAKKPKGKSASAKGNSTLPEFFQDLHKNSKKLEKFSASEKGRAAVIDASNLTDEHKRVLKSGCVPDIIRAFSGLPVTESFADSTAIGCCSDLKCNHPYCNAFGKAATIPVAKAGAKKGTKKPAAKKTKR
jgi:hypothetical protein